MWQSGESPSMATHTGDHGCVEVEIADGVGELRLTNPEKRNAFSRGLAVDLFDLTTAHLVDNDDVRAVAITAEGPVFSAGVDLDLARGGDPDAMDAVHDHRRPVFGWLRDGPVPTIAGAHGAVVGLGVGLYTAADIRLAGADLALWLPEVDHEILPAETAVYLAERVGRAAALELCLAGKPGAADAARLVDMGLVSRVVDPDAVREETLDRARLIADNTEGTDIGGTLLDLLTSVRRESISGSVEAATAAQERARHGDQVTTQGRSLYED